MIHPQQRNQRNQTGEAHLGRSNPTGPVTKIHDHLARLPRPE